LVGLAVTDGSPGHRIFKEGTSKHGFGFIYRDCTAPPGVTMQITSIAAKAGSENAPTGNPQDYPYVVAFASIDSSVFDWDGSPLAISWTLQSGEVLGIKSNYREVRIQGFAYTRESVTIVNLTCVNVPLK
jgi:hypothetical protein